MFKCIIEYQILIQKANNDVFSNLGYAFLFISNVIYSITPKQNIYYVFYLHIHFNQHD